LSRLLRVADDPAVITTTNRGEPVVLAPESETGDAYRTIARRLRGEETSAPSIPQEPSLFARLGAFFG